LEQRSINTKVYATKFCNWIGLIKQMAFDDVIIPEHRSSLCFSAHCNNDHKSFMGLYYILDWQEKGQIEHQTWLAKWNLIT